MTRDIDTRGVQFIDGVVVKGVLWCVDNCTRQLLGINVEDLSVVQKLYLNDYIKPENMPRKIFAKGNKLYITFLYGAKILCVDTEKLGIIEIKSTADMTGCNMKAVLYRNRIYILPRSMNGTVYIYDIDNNEGKEVLINCSENIMIVNIHLHENFLYGVVYKQNRLVRIQLDTMTWEFLELDRKFELIDIVYAAENFWLLEKNNLLCYSKDFRLCHQVVVSSRYTIYSQIVNFKNEILLIPYGITELKKYNISDKTFLELIPQGDKWRRTEKGSLCAGHYVDGDRLLLFPWKCNRVLEYYSGSDVIKGCLVCDKETNSIDYCETNVDNKILYESMFDNLYNFMHIMECDKEMQGDREKIGGDIYRIIRE